MSSLQLLISGDYWHDDFRDQFSKLEYPATMVPLERIHTTSNQTYQLVVLAQSRRDQISQTSVDTIRAAMPGIPIVALLGSWCEGENRSGKPLIGVNQVLWHQWETRFEKFCVQKNDGVKSDWELPLTASVSDRVRDFSANPVLTQQLSGGKFLISSEDRTSFESISDLLNVYQCTTCWYESQSDEVSPSDFAAICVDGNTASPNFLDRVRQLKSQHECLPVIAMLNFPRKQDLNSLAELGVQEVVSKPYTADEFVIPLVRATGEHSERTGQIVPRPAVLSKKAFQNQATGKHPDAS
jgi:CheY-like chemotaxis protein